VNLDRITPVDFRISYTLNRKITQEEVDSVFSWTTKYIQSEKVFSDLKKYHAKRYRYSFARLAIVFTYRDNNEHFECIFFLHLFQMGSPIMPTIKHGILNIMVNLQKCTIQC